MATSENDIKNAVALLLTRHGSLTTTEVKRYLDTVITFDAQDIEQSKTRNEPLIMQRIGNVVSHQKEVVQVYCNQLYQIDKSATPAKWTLLTGMSTNGTLRPLNNTEIETCKLQAKNFQPRKIDWEHLSQKRTTLGVLGEEFALRYETGQVMEFAPNDTGRIIHLSAEQGDGAGFDILSINEDGTQRYIEVKTTEGGFNSPFYMTENERLFFQSRNGAEDTFIYRVYNYDLKSRSGLLKAISAEELFANFNFDPISYRVTLK